VPSVGLDLQSDDEATSKSIKSKSDLDAHPLGLREAALTVYDVSRDASYPSNNLRLITRGFELLYGIDAEGALLLLFADYSMYFQEKMCAKLFAAEPLCDNIFTTVRNCIRVQFGRPFVLRL